WHIVKKEKWELANESNLQAAAQTTIDGSIAWKLFSKSWRRDQAMPFVKIEGDHQLGDVVLDMISVMA
ncbi:MAG TPA: hypothetical protein VD996_07175, partial [Chitinophagaceae bacterium]|nr:hypothetical protein [Chitinophagaceae bacterium]